MNQPLYKTNMSTTPTNQRPSSASNYHPSNHQNLLQNRVIVTPPAQYNKYPQTNVHKPIMAQSMFITNQYQPNNIQYQTNGIDTYNQLINPHSPQENSNNIQNNFIINRNNYEQKRDYVHNTNILPPQQYMQTVRKPLAYSTIIEPVQNKNNQPINVGFQPRLNRPPSQMIRIEPQDIKYQNNINTNMYQNQKKKIYNGLRQSFNHNFNARKPSFQQQDKLLINHIKNKQDQSFNSTLSSTINQNKPVQEPYNNIIKKNLSPPNFWPLSISPYQEKKNLLPEQKGMTQRQTNNQDKLQTFLEFKKKKPLQFTRPSAKKQKTQNIRKNFTLQDFEIIQKIGRGAFGQVFLVQQKQSGFICVIKKYMKKKLKQKNLQQHLLRQIKIQSVLKHRHLVTLFGFFHDEQSIYLIMQSLPDGSLQRVRGKRKISEQDASCYVKQICQGLRYMHNQDVIHRDIKPQNIFVNQGYIKIGDFGCSVHTKGFRNTIIGSLAYLSPQQLKMASYDQKIDVWSMGVMAYQMIVGKSPYQQDIQKIAKQQIAPQLKQLQFPSDLQISQQARDFLQKMLTVDPSKRIGIDEALRHDFLKKLQTTGVIKDPVE